MIRAKEMEVGAAYRPTRCEAGIYYKRPKRTIEQLVKRLRAKHPRISGRESWLAAFHKKHPEAVLVYRYHRGTCGLSSSGAGRSCSGRKLKPGQYEVRYLTALTPDSKMRKIQTLPGYGSKE